MSRYGLDIEVGFADRSEAGRLLARKLEDVGALAEPRGRLVVIGLARGGVEVASEVASALHAPLDALAVRKVGHPWNPEYGIGAVAPGGIEVIRAHDGLTDEEIAQAVRVAAANAEALHARLYANHVPVDVDGATCILVDDGLATGGTMVAAAHWAQARGARHVIVAVPVGASATVRLLESDPSVDSVVCLVAPVDFGAVGLWYGDFHQVLDEDVVELLTASRRHTAFSEEIPVDGVRLTADLTAPTDRIGWVVFAHGSGSSRGSPRNLGVAATLNRAGIATVLLDLLTDDEATDWQYVFDVELLARRLVAVTRWLASRPAAWGLPIGYFGASTGAAAALIAATELHDEVSAVVSRGGRPDLAWHELANVCVPTLLVVGGSDSVVLDFNEVAAAQLTCPHELAIVPGATHLFEEPGALERVAELATAWFTEQFAAGRRVPARSRGGSHDDR